METCQKHYKIFPNIATNAVFEIMGNIYLMNDLTKQ